MRKVMIAVPLKGNVSSRFCKNLLETLTARIPDVSFSFAFLEGPAVQLARCEIVDLARRDKCGELIQLDKDLDGSASAIARLLSHEKELVVCAMYPKRTLDTFWHIQAWDDKEQPDKNGLLRVRQCAIGLSKIRLEIFDRLEADNPDRVGILRDGGDEPKPLWEFFPMELVGPNTPRARLDAIKKILDCPVTPIHEKLLQIDKAAWVKHEGNNYHIGEDYGFCAMLRASGIPILLDTNLIVPHEAGVLLPIPTEQLLKMLDEPWRADDVTKAKTQWWPEDYPRKGIARDHCADVLQGSYDVDFGPEKPPTILDIGANIGAFARWAAVRWPGSTIHCYEPEAGNYALLKRTIKEIIAGAADVIPHELAVSDKDGILPIFEGAYNCGESSLFKHGKEIGKVRVIDAEKLPEADVVKIDVEGAEKDILPRMVACGKLKRTRAIMFEYHADFLGVQLKELLEKDGFTEVGRKVASQHRGELKFMRL